MAGEDACRLADQAAGRRSRWPNVTALGLAIVAFATSCLYGCVAVSGSAQSGWRAPLDRVDPLTGGQAERGRVALRSYGCADCHTIPGVRGADALVGPPLNRMGARVYVAGELPNTPENLMRWIRDPQGVSPLTAMPDTGVSESDARHIAAYLFSLD